jgi:glycosyltransferase involved in cell wall biosynthesis
MGTPRRLTVPFLPLHSPRAVADVDALISAERPDVLHLHNPWPLISLSVVPTAHRRGVPVVATVHNHRHSCMRGSYFRDGHDCRQCEGLSLPWPAVQHGCYRDSRLQSVPMAAAFRLHRKDQRAVDRYVALTQPIADSILRSGLVTADQVVLRPNSVPDPGPPTPPGRGLLYVGRLSVEKGVPLLLQAWAAAGRPFGTLTVVGDGPARRFVEARAQEEGSGVVATGPLDAAGVSTALRGAAALVVPSTAPEGMPLVVLEALAHGRPVLATEGLAGVVDPTVGWLSPPTEAGLAAALTQAAAEGSDSRGASARARYQRRYAPNVVIAAQLAIYRDVLAERR